MNTNYVEFDLGKFYFSHRYNIYNKKDVLSKHIHDYYEIIFIKKGEFEYHFEDSVINVTGGDLLITPPHIYHYLLSGDESSCERYILLVKDEEFKSLINVDKPCKINVFNNEQIYSCYKRFDYYTGDDVGDSVKNNISLLVEMLIKELIINVSEIKEFDNESLYFSNPILSSIVKYINDNLENVTFTSDLMDKFNISESYLNKLFQKHLKITPKRYLVLKKMSLAKKLISEKLPLGDVAIQCGFASYTAFYRTFVEHYKVSPNKMLDWLLIYTKNNAKIM